jgi:ABC-type multidrug transport system ATPase subunit
MTGEQLIAFTAALYPSWDKPFEKELLEILAIPLKRRLSHRSCGERVKLALL